ncbi:MAG: ornithine cyclodeaminase family protein [Chloroflexi bacterium]|nr:ornithine cyclodeaminase family protein [Chloroflexota bacterium]
MLFIDNQTVQQILTIGDAIDSQDTAFRGLVDGAAIHRPRIDMYVPTGREEDYYRWGTMEGASRDLGVFAIRMKSDIVSWPEDENGNWKEEKPGVDPGTYCGLIVLFSTVNGEPHAIINDGELQHMRVGAGGGLGTRYLAREDSRVVGMLGSGGMARTYLRAFCNERPIEKVRVYSPTKRNREAYAAEMMDLLDIDIEPVDDPESAVRGADIVSTCTDAMQPVFNGEWLEPGMHVTNLGGYELDETVFKKANVIIRQGIAGAKLEEDPRIQYGRGHSPVAFVAGTEEEMKRLPPSGGGMRRFSTSSYPTFTDVVNGVVDGRTSRDDITLYLNGGNQGLQFAAVGKVVYDKAREMGLGHEMPTAMFLQDIRD